MEREKPSQPMAQAGEPVPGDGAVPGGSERESFSTMVSGRGTPRSTSNSPPPFAASPPRPLAPPATTSAASQTRRTPRATEQKSSDDFADETPAPRPGLLTEQVGPPPPSSEGSVRLSLTGTGRNLRGVRVALVDTDPTRTDALAMALRARQAEVHVTSFEGDRVHMRLLRKFAPHALLLDEGVLSSTGRSLVEKLRSDPFLSHTKLFPLRLERMYKARVGAASIETVREFLEPLCRAESELLARLGSHVEVEFELDQFPPHRLLRVLATRAEPTTIQCTREKEMLRWTVVQGRTGHAQLYRLGVDEPERVSADEALEWLLRHQNWYVVLTQPTEFDDQTGREVVPMVERKESGLWDAPEPSSARSTKMSGADSLSPFHLDDSGAAVSRFGGRNSWFKYSLLQVPPRWAGAVALCIVGAVLWTQMPASRKTGDNPQNLSGALASKPIDADPPPASPPAPHADARSETPTEAPALPPEPTPEKAPPQEADPRFSVPTGHVTACQELVGAVNLPDSVKTPTQIARIASQHYRAAQKFLVAGKTEKAHVSLCHSALLDPAGPGTLLLVQFALAQRDLETANLWMKQVRAARPSEIEVEELWGDVLHQSGRPEEALGVWLAALGMQPEDTQKRAAVARRFAVHGATSLSSGDYPRAERALRRALSFDPTSPLFARHLATVFARQGLTSLAELWRAEEIRLARGN